MNKKVIIVFGIIFAMAGNALAFTGPSQSVGLGGGLFFASSTKVGIGTANPNAKLHVWQTGTSAALGNFESATNNLAYTQWTNTQNAGYVGIDSSSGNSLGTGDLAGSFGIYSNTAGKAFHIGTSGTVKLTILGTGEVGIGTTAPSSTLHVIGNIQSSGSFIGTLSGGLSATNVSGPSAFGSAYGTYNYAMPGALAVGTTTTTGLPAGGVVSVNTSNSNNRHLVFSGVAGNTWDFYGGHGGGGYFGIAENQGTPFFTILGTSGNVGIGTTNPDSKLTVSANASALTAPSNGATFHIAAADAGYTEFTMDGFAAQDIITARRANGTAASKTALIANDSILNLRGMGYGATGYSASARGRIMFYAAENWTDTAQGTYMTFATVPNGTASPVDVMRIDQNGNVGIGATAPDAKLQISGAYYSPIVVKGNCTGAVTIDWSAGNTQHCVLTGNVTFTFTNGRSGGSYKVVLKQDGTGSRTVTWPASVRWGSLSTPSLSVVPAKTDYIGFIYNGVDSTYDGVAFNANY